MKNDHGPPTDTRDDVATLLRLAGKRQAVPEERARRVREAAQAEWRRQVALHSRRRTLWVGAGLAAAASLLVAVTFALRYEGTPLPGAPDDAVRLEALAGPTGSRVTVDGDTVEVGAPGAWADRSIGSELETDAASRAAVRLASGHSVRLDTSTRVRLLEAGALALDRGALYVDSGAGTSGAAPLQVHTALGVVRETGTQYEVRLQGGSVRLRLREGMAVLRAEDGAHEARAGTELRMGADGTLARRAIAVHGPEWEWMAGVTPMLDLEGRSAREFLDWVARERGWTLAFADREVARSAGEIVLGGKAGRLTLAEALDAVLPTCRMTHRVEEGVLRIASAP